MKTIQLTETIDRWQRFGIRYVSGVIKVTGRGVRNPSFPHTVRVWDNTVRPYEDCYFDPHGKPTDDKETITLTAGTNVIDGHTGTGWRGWVEYVAEVKVGEAVQLVFPDETWGLYRVEAQRYTDPILVDVSLSTTSDEMFQAIRLL